VQNVIFCEEADAIRFAERGVYSVSTVSGSESGRRLEMRIRGVDAHARRFFFRAASPHQTKELTAMAGHWIVGHRSVGSAGDLRGLVASGGNAPLDVAD
jgi:hypothetical protein